MNGWIEAALLGLLQGLTEFLPISSSAHLRIAGAFLPSGTDPGAAFTAITQIGTEAAVLLYFRRDIWRIATAGLRSLPFVGRARAEDAADVRMGWLVILGSLPIAVFGLAFKETIEGPLRNLYLTASMLILFAVFLGFADLLSVRRKPLESLGWRDGLIFGFAQALALIPGVSRSGGTITAGLAMGYTREAAARYSFLLAIPAVLASGFLELFDSWGRFAPMSPGQTALATIVAFAVGYGVIALFLRFIATRSYMPFVFYRIVAGSTLLALLFAGIIAPV